MRERRRAGVLDGLNSPGARICNGSRIGGGTVKEPPLVRRRGVEGRPGQSACNSRLWTPYCRCGSGSGWEGAARQGLRNVELGEAWRKECLRKRVVHQTQ